jgi:hypothetical protein
MLGWKKDGREVGEFLNLARNLIAASDARTGERHVARCMRLHLYTNKSEVTYDDQLGRLLASRFL